MTSTTDPPDDAEVHRPRTVRPGLSGPPLPVIRPRTVGALGRPDPIVAPPFEPLADPRHRRPSRSVPLVLDDAVPPGDLPPTDPWDDLWVIDEDAETETETETETDGGVDGIGGADHGARGDAAADGTTAPAGVLRVPGSGEGEATAGALAADAATSGSGAGSAAPPSRLLRNNLFVASGTLVSRITGLVRTTLVFVLLAETLGDAYVTANNTPNMIYELILGGILTATLVPLFSDDLEKGGRDGATDAIISFALVALALVTVVAFVAAPLIVLLLATGSTDASRDDYVAIAVPLALLFAPQVFFYGLMAVWSAVLNARQRFLAAAWAPVLNNVLAIATLGVVWRMAGGAPSLQDARDDRTILVVLGLGTTAGIATMALALYPSIRRAGVRFRFRFDRKHPAVQRAVRLSGWTLGYVAANQVAVLVVGILAEPGSGGNRDYQTAFQFFQLPHGLLAVSIMVTFEPLLGRADSRGDRVDFNRQLLLGFRLIGLLIIPAAVGYVALPLGLDHRTFVATDQLEDVFGLTGIIAAFAVGLPGFSAYLYALRAFYAMKNTRIPFLVNCFENAVNIVAAVVLVRLWGVAGLALSFALAYTLAAIVAVVVLHRHSPGFDWRGLVRTWLQLLLAAAVMGAFVFGVVFAASPGSALMTLPTVAGAIVVGALVYLATIYVLQVQGISELFARLPGLRRFSPRP